MNLLRSDGTGKSVYLQKAQELIKDLKIVAPSKKETESQEAKSAINMNKND